MDRLLLTIKNSGMVWVLGILLPVALYIGAKVNSVEFELARQHDAFPRIENGITAIAKDFSDYKADHGKSDQKVEDDIAQLKTTSLDHENRIKSLEMKVK